MDTKKEKQSTKLNYMKMLQNIQSVIFSLNKVNIMQTVNLFVDFYDHNYTYSFNLMVSQIIYSLLVTKYVNDVDIYLNCLIAIQTKEEEINSNNSKILEIFGNYINGNNSQESLYLIQKMIERNLIDKNIIKSKISKYFAHYKTEKENKVIYNDEFCQAFLENFEELSKNNFELHKKLIEEGHNPSEIAKIIRNDEIEKLQEISSQNNFNFNQHIQPSLYERCSFVNQVYPYVTLIDYAAFFSSVKCFKYLLMNGAKVENTGKYAVAGGNEEIIHLCEQNHSSFEDAYEAAIMFHRNDVFRYISEIVRMNNLEELEKKCISYHNYEILSFLIGRGMKITNDIINESATIGNIFLIKYFVKEHEIPEDILVYSSKSGNIELIKYIFDHKQIDINAKGIYL